MFKKLIVGVDEHQGARDAIALAERLVKQDGEVTLVHVYPGDARVWRGSNADYDEVERERSLALLAQARDEAGVKTDMRCLGAPSPGRGLHVLAEEVGADLIIVGSCRRGLIGRVLIGDDTRAALNGAPCAVAIAPAGYAEAPRLMREIGVAYNASQESEHALALARALASEYDAKLSAFEAVSLPAYGFAGGMPALTGEAIDGMVHDAYRRIETLDGVEPHAAYGRPSEELGLYSASLDLLVVGSRDYGPAGRLVHGSTSQQLARSARCPLLVLTRAARSAQTQGMSRKAREDATIAVGA